MAAINAGEQNTTGNAVYFAIETARAMDSYVLIKFTNGRIRTFRAEQLHAYHDFGVSIRVGGRIKMIKFSGIKLVTNCTSSEDAKRVLGRMKKERSAKDGN